MKFRVQKLGEVRRRGVREVKVEPNPKLKVGRLAPDVLLQQRQRRDAVGPERHVPFLHARPEQRAHQRALKVVHDLAPRLGRGYPDRNLVQAPTDPRVGVVKRKVAAYPHRVHRPSRERLILVPVHGPPVQAQGLDLV